MTPGTLTQQFPIREGDKIVHRRWAVDLKIASCAVRASPPPADRLRSEVSEMCTHLPRWVLTVAGPREPLACACGGLLVFDRGLRCVACGRTRAPSDLPGTARLAWFGLMPPVGIDSLKRVKRALAKGAPPRHVVGSDPELGTYLLVPLVAAYPPGYPACPPQVIYQPGFFRIRGTPPDHASHEAHLYGQGVMCLFASGQWTRSMTVRQVLQQRAYAHVIKMLNYTDGKHRSFAKVS